MKNYSRTIHHTAYTIQDAPPLCVESNILYLFKSRLELSEISVIIFIMATFGKGVEYALHCLLYLDSEPGTTLVVRDIAKFQGVSETYLAKVFTKLKKAGIVRSSIGAKGGYELAKNTEDITFWDVVEAVEGELNLFECRNVRMGNVLYKDADEKPKWLTSGPCEIHKVMLDVEEQIKTSLKAKTLAWLSQAVIQKIPEQELTKAALWFQGGSRE